MQPYVLKCIYNYGGVDSVAFGLSGGIVTLTFTARMEDGTVERTHVLPAHQFFQWDLYEQLRNCAGRDELFLDPGATVRLHVDAAVREGVLCYEGNHVETPFECTVYFSHATVKKTMQWLRRAHAAWADIVAAGAQELPVFGLD